MEPPKLYRGLWPQNVSRLAKYAVRSEGGDWKVTVFYEAGEGLRYLAVEGDGSEVVDRINAVKSALRDKPGGAFYVNEFRHILVPVAAPGGQGTGSHYCAAGRFEGDFRFEFEGRPLTTKPLGLGGTQLRPGDRWIGPRPGIPYVLAAGGADIYYETPALTDTDPPEVRPNMTRKILLSKVIKDASGVARAVRPIAAIRGHQGGRFYVNEHAAIFTPISGGDGDGLQYTYCGQIDRTAWFPEPLI
jgi:hypothetical protein